MGTPTPNPEDTMNKPPSTLDSEYVLNEPPRLLGADFTQQRAWQARETTNRLFADSGYPVWGTVQFPADIQIDWCELDLFSWNCGLALLDGNTNLRESNQIPGGLAYHVRSVAIHLMGDQEDLEKLIHGSSWQWSLNHFRFDGHPLDLLDREWLSPTEVKLIHSYGKNVLPIPQSALVKWLLLGPEGMIPRANLRVRVLLSGSMPDVRLLW